MAAGIIFNVFDTTTVPVTYRIKLKFLIITTGWGGLNMSVGSTSYTQVITQPTISEWTGIDERITLTDKSQKNLKLGLILDSAATDTEDFLIRDFQILKVEGAEVQDSDLRSAGRRTSYYEGCKMTSMEVNINSPDTPDGGPVIVVNTVNDNSISSTPSPNAEY